MKKFIMFFLIMLSVVFFTNNIYADVQRLKLRPDGTVIDEKVNLIWHRNPQTPGESRLPTSGETSGTRINMFEYIDNLNAGVYGTDPVNGNAGYTDWRIPKLNDLCCLYDPMQKNLRLPNKMYPPTGENAEPHVYGDPFYICNYFDGPEICPEEHQNWDAWLTQTPCQLDDMGWAPCTPGTDYAIMWGWATEIWSDGQTGEIWPVRGPLGQ